jgi:DNA-binding MltR family transcriptional regulator
MENSIPEFDRFEKIMNELFCDNERAAVLVAVALIDDLVNELIIKYTFIENDEDIVAELTDPMRNSPLGTFVSRIKFAYAIGLISKEQMNDLKIVAKIRNMFAHRTTISFQDPEVITLCSKLEKTDLQINSSNNRSISIFKMYSAFVIGLLGQKISFVREQKIKGTYR